MSIAAVLLAAAAAAAPPSGHAAVIVNPDWVRKPTADEIAYFYPKLPATLGVEGRAWVHCELTIEGAPGHCVITSESPGGLGFGDAALALASTFRFSPKRVNGQPVAGGTVTIPIRFNMDTPPTPPARPLPTLAGVEPGKAALARRFAELVIADEMAPGPSNPARRMAAATAVQGDPASREQLVQAFEAAFAKLRPQLVEVRAALAAQAFTTDQLTATVAFLESNAGQVFRMSAPAMAKDLGAFFATQRPAVIAEAVKTYCAQPGACPPPPPKDDN